MAAVIWRRRKPVCERYNAIGEFNDRKTGTIKEAAKKKHRKTHARNEVGSVVGVAYKMFISA